MTIKQNSVVVLHYTLKNDAGEVLDSSQGNDPLQYLHGHGNIVPGLEEALTGKSANDSFDVVVPPEKGYGLHSPDRVLNVSREQLPPGLEPEPGMVLGVRGAEGPPIPVTITAVQGDQVELDANHALAGQTLHFQVTVDAVRDATPEEVAHGHVHGPDAHPGA